MGEDHQICWPCERRPEPRLPGRLWLLLALAMNMLAFRVASGQDLFIGEVNIANSVEASAFDVESVYETSTDGQITAAVVGQELNAPTYAFGVQQMLECQGEYGATQESRSNGTAVGKIMQKTRTSVDIELTVAAHADAGRSYVCDRGWLPFFQSESVVEVTSPAAAYAASRAAIPVNIPANSTAESFDLLLQTDYQGQGILTYEIVNAAGESLIVSNPTEDVRIQLPGHDFGAYTVFAEIAAASYHDPWGSNAENVTTNVSLNIVEAQVDTPKLSDLISEQEPEALIWGGRANGDSLTIQAVALFIDKHHYPDCSGTIIGARTVLTAAHCVDTVKTEPQSVSIKIGQDSVVADSARTWKVRSIRLPDGQTPGFEYDSNIFSDDIALVYVCRDFTQPTGSGLIPIAPLAVHSGEASWEKISEDHRSFKFVGFGFGNLSGGDGRGQRRAVRLKPTLLSAQTFKIETTKGGTCHGDSGGPALLLDEPTQIVGIVSKGYHRPDTVVPRGCKTDSYNTRLDVYADWINKHKDRPDQSTGADACN